MKTKFLLAVSISASLFVGLPYSTVSAASAGGTCKKIGSISGTLKKPLVCKKVSGKLKWVASAVSTNSTPSVSDAPITTTTTVENSTTTVENTTTTVQNTISTTVTSTKPALSNLSYSTTIRPGTSLTVAFTVTSIIGINNYAAGIVTFTHEGGGGSFGKSFSEWTNNLCVRTSELSLNCEGAIQFSETAAVGSYRLYISGFRNPNNVSVQFIQSRALTVAT